MKRNRRYLEAGFVALTRLCSHLFIAYCDLTIYELSHSHLIRLIGSDGTAGHLTAKSRRAL